MKEYLLFRNLINELGLIMRKEVQDGDNRRRRKPNQRQIQMPQRTREKFRVQREDGTIFGFRGARNK